MAVLGTGVLGTGVLGTGVGGAGVSPVEATGGGAGGTLGVTGAGADGVTVGVIDVGVSVAVGDGDAGGAPGGAGVLALGSVLTGVASPGAVPQPGSSGIAVSQSALSETTLNQRAFGKIASDRVATSPLEVALEPRRFMQRSAGVTDRRMTMCPYAPHCVIDRGRSALSKDA